MRPEYVGRRVWVRWDGRTVRIFNDRWEQLALHAKAEPGKFRTCPEHIPTEKISSVERGADRLLRYLSHIGPHTRQWSEALMQARGVESIRVLVGLKTPAGTHDSKRLDKACKAALSHGAYRLRTIRELLKRDKTDHQEQFVFIEEHPIIRPLKDYSLESLHEFRRNQIYESDTDGFFEEAEVKRKQIYDLAAGEFLREGRGILFCGPPGTDKSHIVQAIVQPVIVEERHYVSPPPYYYHRPRHHRPLSQRERGDSSQRELIQRYYAIRRGAAGPRTRYSASAHARIAPLLSGTGCLTYLALVPDQQLFPDDASACSGER